ELIKHFQFLKQQSGKTDFHLSAMHDAGREDWGNVDYLADVAYNAGWNIHQLAVEDIGYNSETEKFVDLNDQHIE
ncbi:glutathionylspermidine synthase family protein, partial [Stenotrophomonas maltophilia]